MVPCPTQRLSVFSINEAHRFGEGFQLVDYLLLHTAEIGVFRDADMCLSVGEERRGVILSTLAKFYTKAKLPGEPSRVEYCSLRSILSLPPYQMLVHGGLDS